ncbi:hypothetical protein EVC27_016 [Rhizobium phage RHph_I1_6]|uniref:Uncharacterized protein n=1 Tax=Rhizobium phage RHph_I1_6 TaxID=2509728 RepID=A0A7S5RFF2_9CAUD|nr:hypothetical protein PP745_gp016 [Rhizobium phage RHph_I1_6]QIG76541.1 hypothetical protein EVC27_016 [Rhizobium phage RHph_I1_6]
MTAQEEINATERWIDLRKRLAIKLLDTVQHAVVQLEAGATFDSYSFVTVMNISDYCDKVLLGTKEKN